MTIDRGRLRRILREARQVALVPAILWVAYLALAAIFGAATTDRGLVSPDDLELGLLALGAATLGLRALALGLAPALLVYKLSARLLRPRRAPDATAGDDDTASRR